MHTLPNYNQPTLFPHLAAWFRYRHPKPAGMRLKRNEQNHTPLRIPVVTTAEDYFPLTHAEEERLKILERKAKQENLSGSDSAEYHILKEVKLYHRYKEECPHVPHITLVLMVKKAM